MEGPLQERRRARDGKVYTFADFVAWYGEHPEMLKSRWGSAAPATGFILNERALAVQLQHAFRSDSLHYALQGCWCQVWMLRHVVAFELLRLDPSLAGVRGPTGALPLAVSLLQGTKGAIPLREALLAAHPPAARDPLVLRNALIARPKPPLFEELLRASELAEMQPVKRLLVTVGIAERFARDRSGLWRAMEAGAVTPPNVRRIIADIDHVKQSWPATWPTWREGVSAAMVAKALAAWRHGEVLRRGLVMRNLMQIMPAPAAALVASFVCGGGSCGGSARGTVEKAASSASGDNSLPERIDEIALWAEEQEVAFCEDGEAEEGEEEEEEEDEEKEAVEEDGELPGEPTVVARPAETELRGASPSPELIVALAIKDAGGQPGAGADTSHRNQDGDADAESGGSASSRSSGGSASSNCGGGSASSRSGDSECHVHRPSFQLQEPLASLSAEVAPLPPRRR